MLREWKGSGLGKLITICIYPDNLLLLIIINHHFFLAMICLRSQKTKMNELELANKGPQERGKPWNPCFFSISHRQLCWSLPILLLCHSRFLSMHFHVPGTEEHVRCVAAHGLACIILLENRGFSAHRDNKICFRL